MPTGVWPR